MIKDATKLNKDFSNLYVIYTRKSTDDAENQKNSIAYQIMETELFSKRENLQLAELTIDGFCTNGIIEEHHSGYKQDDDFESNTFGTITYKVLRPKFLQLVNFVKQKEFKGIICLCWDRISRNEADDVLIKKLINQGVDIRFVQASYDDSSSGALHMDIDGMFSRHYSRVISEKVKASNKKLLAEGRCIYTSPIGYFDEGSNSKPFDPIRAPLVKRIFELYASGEYSLTTLAQWANDNGLTTKPQRRKRTNAEKASGLELNTLIKTTRPINKKAIENILNNPFYIGKIVNNGNLINSTAHSALIDTGLFYKVHAMLKSKNISVQYPEKRYFTYRGLLSCATCGRIYTPYEKKRINYYRSNCKASCTNTHRNINISFIDDRIKELLGKISFNNEELAQIEIHAHKALSIVTEKRNKEVEDLHRKLTKALGDMDYLVKDKLNLLRTGVFTHEQVKEEEMRLNLDVEDIQNKLSANTESTKAMLDYVITFSELVKDASLFLEGALDADKRDVAMQMFYELSLDNGKLKYVAKEGFGALLKRFDDQYFVTGAPHYLFSELIHIYPLVKKSMERLQKTILS